MQIQHISQFNVGNRIAVNCKTKNEVNPKPLFSNPFKMGNAISTLKALMRPEPQKTYVKIGLLHEDGTPTQEGIEFVIAHLLDEKDSPLFDKAKKVLKEMGKDK